jgi:hypothetical protein
MKLRRDVLIAVLATFCLTSSLFAVKPSGSQTERQYDPWADVNDDGIINMKDTVYTILLFNTKGDPTKPIIVNGYYAEEWNKTYSLNQGKSNVTWVYTKGLRKITFRISIWPGAWAIDLNGNKHGIANATISIERQILNQTIWSETVLLDAAVTIYSTGTYMGMVVIQGTTYTEREFDIAFSSIKITVYARSTIKVTELYYVTA